MIGDLYGEGGEVEGHAPVHRAEVEERAILVGEFIVTLPRGGGLGLVDRVIRVRTLVVNG